MRHSYYIKMVYGSTKPSDRTWREGENDYLHFREEQQTSCDHFAGATGFLVFETKHARGDYDGAQTIFAMGYVESLGCKNVWAEQQVEDDHGNTYPLGVEVRFEKIVSPTKGVALDEIYQLCPRLQGQLSLPAHGGLIGITPEEFALLRDALDQKT